MEGDGGAADVPYIPSSPPPRAMCVGCKSYELVEAARALFGLVLLQQDDSVPASTIEAICSVSVASVVARELYSKAMSTPRNEDALALVLKMVEDPAVMIPEVRRSLTALKQLWGDNHVTAALTEEDLLYIMFGEDEMKYQGLDYEDSARDGGSLSCISASAGGIGSNKLGLVTIKSTSKTSGCFAIHVDRGSPLSPKEWCQRRRVKGGNGSDVFITQILGSWVVAFPVSSPISESTVRQRCIIIPITSQPVVDSAIQRIQHSSESKALRDLFFGDGGDDITDDTASSEDDGSGDPVGFVDVLTVEQLLNALVLGFALASVVKLIVFFARCDHPWKSLPEGPMRDGTCIEDDPVVVGPSPSAPPNMHDLGMCFVFGPLK